MVVGHSRKSGGISKDQTILIILASVNIFLMMLDGDDFNNVFSAIAACVCSFAIGVGMWRE